jgi:hypothetical protein
MNYLLTINKVYSQKKKEAKEKKIRTFTTRVIVLFFYLVLI